MIRTAFYTLLTLITYFFLYIVTAILVLIAFIFGLFHMKRVVRVLTLIWTKLVFIILLKKLHIRGLEYMDRNKKYLILTNHASAFDVNAIMSFCPEVSWFGREYLLKIPLFGQFLKMLNYIPMKDAGYKNAKTMIDQLVQKSNGLNIAIFPEGTRTLDGNISRFHKGFIHILRKSDNDILPVTLNGFYRFKPKNRFYFNFNARISAIIHKPIAKDELVTKTDNEIIQIVKATILSAYQI